MLNFKTKNEWKKCVRIFLENSTVPYDKEEFKWPPMIYSNEGSLYFKFNEFIDYIPNNLNIDNLSNEDKNKIIELFECGDFEELKELLRLREEFVFCIWNEADLNNIREELENALFEEFGYNFIIYSEEEIDELENMDENGEFELI